MGLFLVQLMVLGEVVGRADNVESLLDGSVLVGIRRESLRDRILRLIRMQRIRDWALRGFVVFRERTVGDGADGHKQTADAFCARRGTCASIARVDRDEIWAWNSNTR
jgi:hypothetical protein